jgi:hypothetical protein
MHERKQAITHAAAGMTTHACGCNDPDAASDTDAVPRHQSSVIS